MNITTLSNFKARINDIEFNNEQDFNSVSFLLENIEERFNISITDSDFTKDVKDFVELASIKVNDFSYDELENATATSIMNATKLSDIQFLANEYDDGNYKWNSYINDKVKEDRGYPYIIDAIVREQFNAIESNNSIDTLLTTPLNNDLSIQDKEELYDNVNEYFTNNFLDDDYDDDFEFLYPKDNIYDTDVNQIVPSVFKKKLTLGDLSVSTLDTKYPIIGYLNKVINDETILKTNEVKESLQSILDDVKEKTLNKDFPIHSLDNNSGSYKQIVFLGTCKRKDSAMSKQLDQIIINGLSEDSLNELKEYENKQKKEFPKITFSKPKERGGLER